MLSGRENPAHHVLGGDHWQALSRGEWRISHIFSWFWKTGFHDDSIAGDTSDGSIELVTKDWLNMGITADLGRPQGNDFMAYHSPSRSEA